MSAQRRPFTRRRKSCPFSGANAPNRDGPNNSPATISPTPRGCSNRTNTDPITHAARMMKINCNSVWNNRDSAEPPGLTIGDIPIYSPVIQPQNRPPLTPNT